MKRQSEAELCIEAALVDLFGAARSEYQFCPGRKFKADWAVPGERLLVELEGGVFTRQAHGSITGILRDIEKYRLAAIHGWFVMRFLPSEAKDGTAAKLLREYRKSRA